MSETFEIVSVDKDNYTQHPGAICFINKKHPAHPLKTDWLEKRFVEGLQIKLLYTHDKKKVAGFIEYVPGEFVWRAVSASDYMFIHCLYVYPNANKNRGLGTLLITECINDTKQKKQTGVAVLTSSKAFMAQKELFLKNNFQLLADDGAGNELLILKLREGPVPVINDWTKKLAAYTGLHIIYSKQCPWVARMVEEIRNSKITKELNLKIEELTTPVEAQNAPSLYSAFNLIYNGRLLADRYISLTRFNNILKKEKLI